MPLARTCARCAAPLSDDAPEGALCAVCEGEAASSPAAATLKIAAAKLPVVGTVGDFEVLGKLGQGGMGAVYRARQRSLGRIVALKVLPQQLGEDAEFVSRFLREARVASSLTHANLVRVFTSGQVDGTHFIAMELIEGENLHERMRRERPTIPEALHITAEIARGLQCGWDRAQLVHRDIKPSNIYLSHDGAVKLGDLGIAKTLSGNTTGLTQTGTMIGTPHYMSPEQIRGDKTIDFRADIYSLGCTLYEMLTGAPPYPGNDAVTIIHQHINAPLPALLKVLPGCPMPLARVVGRMLKKTPRERHPSYADLIAELDHVREQVESGVTHTGPTGVAQAWKQLNEEPIFGAPKPGTPRPATEAAPGGKPKLSLYAGLAFVVVALGAVGVMLTTSPKKKPTRISAPAAVPSSPPPVFTPPAAERPKTLPTARLSASTEAWQDAMPQEEAGLVADGSARRATKDFFSGPRWIPSSPGKEDGAVRILVAPPGGSLQATDLRARVRDGNGYRFALSSDGQRASLYAQTTRSDSSLRLLTEALLPQALNSREPYEMELRIEGTHLTGKVNGATVCEAEDAAYPAGYFQIKLPAGATLLAAQHLPLTAGAATPAAGAAAPAGSEAWRDALDGSVKLNIQGTAEQRPEGLRFAGSASVWHPHHFRDAAVRMRAAFGKPVPQLRARMNPKLGLYGCNLSDSSHLVFQHWDPVQLRATVIGTFPLPRTLQPGEEYELEFRVVGQKLSARFNGTPLGSVTDASYTEGNFGVGVSEAITAPVGVKSLEILDLDAPATASTAAPQPATAKPAPAAPAPAGGEQWTDLLQTYFALVEERQQPSTIVDKVPEGARLKKTGAFNLPGPARQNVALRATVRGIKQTLLLAMRVSVDNGDLRSYNAVLKPDGSSEIYRKGGPAGSANLSQRAPIPGFDPAARHTFEFRAVDDVLTVIVDGQAFEPVRDANFKKGGLSLTGDAGMIIEKLEVADLKAAPTASPAAAP